LRGPESRDFPLESLKSPRGEEKGDLRRPTLEKGGKSSWAEDEEDVIKRGGGRGTRSEVALPFSGKSATIAFFSEGTAKRV